MNSNHPNLSDSVSSSTSFVLETVKDISSDLVHKGPVLTLKEATLDVADLLTESVEIVSAWMRPCAPPVTPFPENYSQQPGDQFAKIFAPPDLLD
jgi:hypothetical protein